MKRIVIFFLSISFLILMSCNNNSNSNRSTEESPPVDQSDMIDKTPYLSNLMPEINAADSAAVMYYETPDNPRFFKYVKVLNTGELSQVIMDINSKAIDQQPDCATRGKIYFYGKSGAIYVAYFSDFENCMTFSIIVTGEKYFVKMSEESKNILDKLKPMAKEPGSSDQ